ncbi:MAG: glycosyltransferase family 4 protein [Candidatus Omnitrophica bacterium]|nr:glycosyltransferase family 4 protein [Candidatus Omnitrophota bacterium]
MPDNHMWGVNYLGKYGIVADILPFSKYKLLRKISLMYFTGDLDQQVRLAHRVLKTKYDYIYTAQQNTIWLMTYVRKIWKRIPPIIAVLHSVPHFKNKFFRKMLFAHINKIDKIICISKKNYDLLIGEAGFSSRKVWYSEEGVDLNFYKPKKVNRDIILSVGKTLRDYRTLCEAMIGVDKKCVIVCDKKDVRGIDAKAYPNVEFVTTYLSYPDLFALYDRAIAVVVPLQKIHRKYGITSVLEGLAMARPVIMTKNEYIDVGLEEYNCGLFCGKEDVDSMKRHLLFLIKNVNIADDMGSRGRKLIEERYDSAVFADKLAQAITKN